ncbi:Thiosulfate sulfurtransferase/rhodanese-like domain-containing protein 1 [Anabarilius grahami]|uniref:Thiosulfate sulfurtransferase/rhodanese-like domain-containing protein 1 n=1 Tax=Anabarilius grahami TaxID=495550 RepID=A0A3N0XXJ3_ANAGA|nr:Thiosulfate sulfurtransferase/rhodanese-like domain-containing protein 1 [Anabarilius grahami]
MTGSSHASSPTVARMGLCHWPVDITGGASACVRHDSFHCCRRGGVSVTYEQLKAMLANHSVQLFDVRNPDEFQAGRIPDSINIPLGQLEESLKLPPKQFQLQFMVKAPKKEDDNIVFHCRSGKRSLSALEIAHRLGFSKARHYAGGYIDWEEREKK